LKCRYKVRIRKAQAVWDLLAGSLTDNSVYQRFGGNWRSLWACS